MKISVLAFLSFLLVPSLVSAIEISDAWVRAPIEQVNVTAGYLTLTNSETEDDILLSVETDLAAKSEIHTVSEGEGGMMRMRPLAELEIPAGQTRALKPGGDHLMLTGLEEAVEDGDSVTLRLTFQRFGIVEVDVPIARRDPFN